MKQFWCVCNLVIAGYFYAVNCFAFQQPPGFKVLVLYENVGHHIVCSTKANQRLNKLAADSRFTISYTNNTDAIDDNSLQHYQLFIQLDYPRYGCKAKAVAAFKRYIEQGRGGGIGFHHASLPGEFDDYPIWHWFADFMGGIRCTNYIPGFADATVQVEDTRHACIKNVPGQFTISKEEWYTYNKSPRQNIHVIASVDESTYSPCFDIKMGDHPVISTNLNYPVEIFIFSWVIRRSYLRIPIIQCCFEIQFSGRQNKLL